MPHDVYPQTLIGLCALALFLLAGLAKLWMELQATVKKTDATSKQASETSVQVAAAVGKINEVHEQTVNDHLQKSNLRDDVDITRDATIATQVTAEAIFQMMSDMRERQMAQGRELGGMRADMTGVRADMTGVRTDLTAVNDRLHAERERSISADEKLWTAIYGRQKSGDEPG